MNEGRRDGLTPGWDRGKDCRIWYVNTGGIDRLRGALPGRPKRQPPSFGQENRPASERPLWAESGRRTFVSSTAGLRPEPPFAGPQPNRSNRPILESHSWPDNAFIESLNDQFRAECLSVAWFPRLDEARRRCENTRRGDNEVRRHALIATPSVSGCFIGRPGTR